MAGAKDRDDGQTKAMLYEGASISQLTQLFDMDARDVSKKLREVPPSGERRGFPIWNVRDAAEALIPPAVSDSDILGYIQGMNFRDLPPALNKEVWNGLRARLRYELEQGDLWPTDRIQTIVNALVQTVRMGILLLPDKLARVDDLSPRQRSLLEKFADEVLLDLQAQIEKAMDELDPMTPGIMDFTGDGDVTGKVAAGVAAAEAADIQEAGEEDFDL
jgi:hypothetical protein